jgi:hypothetical protein
MNSKREEVGVKTKYRAYGLDIQKVTAVRETEKSMWLEPDKYGAYRRVSKTTSEYFYCYFDSWAEAHLSLLINAKADVYLAEKKLVEKLKKLDAVQAITDHA